MRNDPQAQDWTSLIEAVCTTTRPALDDMINCTIDVLKALGPTQLFGGVLTNHLWDEYCWQLQEGPFDDNFGFGSLSDNFDQTVRACIRTEIDKHSCSMQQYISIFAQRAILDDDGFDPSVVAIDTITDWLKEEVDYAASRRDLSLLGPYRLTSELNMNVLNQYLS